MHRFRRHGIRWLASLACLATVASPAHSQAINSRVIDDLVQDALKAWDVPGAAVVIVKGNRVVHVQGYGVRDLGTQQAVTPDTLFPLASCTKAFTTLAMAMLVDEGKMKWDDPVRRHVPFFRLADPLADANVTLRDLVCHRTGVAAHDLLHFHAPWGVEERVRRIGRVEPSRSFRSTFQYQSIMFMAAGLAVGNASGSTWDQFVQKRILTPLDMTQTLLTSPTVPPTANRTSAHRRNRQGQIEVIPSYKFSEPDAAGSIYSNVRDLAKWLVFQLGDGTFRSHRLVSAENLGETHLPQTVIRLEGPARAEAPFTIQMSYGMGWVIQDYKGHRLVSHAGIIDGVRAHITLAPDNQFGLAILSNLHATRMNLALSNQLMDHLLGLQPYTDWNRHFLQIGKAMAEAAEVQRRKREEQRQPNTRPSRELTAYTGSYEEPAYGTATVQLENGKLAVHWSTFRCPLEYHQFDTFTNTNDTIIAPDVVFTLNAQGDVATLRLDGIEFRRANSKDSRTSP